MNFLPKVPFDNLYKTMTISGVLLLIGFVYVVFWFYTLNYEYGMDLNRYTQLNIQRNNLISLEKSIEALESDSTKAIEDACQVIACKVIISSNKTKQKKINELKTLKVKISTEIQKEQSNLDNRIKERSDVLNNLYNFKNLFWLLVIYSVIMLFFLLGGFLMWYILHQRPMDKMASLEVEKIEKEIELLKCEIKKHNKPFI